ncbi:DEKNAAC100379 [Brettanomyces naardenensis]|uniref:DEKNAAC100379 n=1 Tax=Brettanomyces naardenensis TaxID=13370 RepID=A0A448YGD2_BRENA|nr:DEKNAAC100379 [Brettanomyces naardenensis]
MSGGPVPVWKKYTTGSKGIWETVRKLLVAVPNRSSGNPYVPYYRVPAPASNPGTYIDARTIPASDIVKNNYFDRDTRRKYPRTSTFTQSKIGGLLTVGSEANSRLPDGEEGVKQLTVVDENKLELVDVLKSAPASVINGEVLGKQGEPIVAPNLNKAFKVRILTEEESGMYNDDYPVRVFTVTK